MSDSGSISPPEVDFSVIRTSIDMGHSMIDQILNGIHYGSVEIRRLLREECDFVMECKVCRNLFRSFANFVAHKRVYCVESIEEKEQRGSLVSEEIETVVIQPESPDINERQKTDGGVNESVIDQVVNKTYKSNSKEYQLYTKVAEKIVNAKSNKVTNTLTFKQIPTTSEAVTVEYSQSDSSTRKDPEFNAQANELGKSKERFPDLKDTTKKKKCTLTEVCTNLLEKQSSTNSERIQKTRSPVAALQSDRARKSVPKKVFEQYLKSNKTPMEVDDDIPEWTSDTNQNKVNKPSQNTQRKTTPEKMETSPNNQHIEKPWIKFCDFDKIYCTKCEKTFSSVDSLKLHAKTLHGEKRATSKCPLCLKELCYFSSVERHLRNVHKKTEVQIAEYRKKMQARSKFVEVITPQSKNKQQSSNSAITVWKGWKKCDKCQKYFSKARTYKAHLKTKCSATVRAKNKNVDNKNKSDEINSSSRAGNLKGSSKNIDINQKIENPENATGKVKQSGTSSKTGDSNNVYEEKVLDKESMLYKALTSINSNTTKVVYVYPKSPLQDTNQDGRKDVDISKDVTKTIPSDTPKEKESSSIRKSSEKDRKPQVTSEKRESRHRSVEKQVTNSSHSTETTKSRDGEGKKVPEEPNSSVSDSQRPKDNLKTIEELDKLKDRLMNEATGQSPNKSDEKQRWWKGNKSKGKESQSKNNSGRKFQLSLTDIRRERTPVKSPDRLSSSSFRSSETSSIRDSPSSTSFPNSPASADGYSHKFKMSVKEMAELVETAGLTKFARERKKHAQTTLNKKSSREGLSGKLIKPMKRDIRGKKILPVKSYSTRLAAGSRTVGNKIKDGLEYVDRRIRSSLGIHNLKDHKNPDKPFESKIELHKDRDRRVKGTELYKPDDSTSDDGGEFQQIQNKKLSRELKLLANSAGFNEKGYYDTHTGSEGSSSTDDQIEWRQRRELKDRYVDKAQKNMAAVNILKQKLMAAQKSISNSKSVMNKRSPDKNTNSNRRSQDKTVIEDEKTLDNDRNKRSPDKDYYSPRRSQDKADIENVKSQDISKDNKNLRSLDKSDESDQAVGKESNRNKRSQEKDKNANDKYLDKENNRNTRSVDMVLSERLSDKDKIEYRTSLDKASTASKRSEDNCINENKSFDDNSAHENKDSEHKTSSEGKKSIDREIHENQAYQMKHKTLNENSVENDKIEIKKHQDKGGNKESADNNSGEGKGSPSKDSREKTPKISNESKVTRLSRSSAGISTEIEVSIKINIPEKSSKENSEKLDDRIKTRTRMNEQTSDKSREEEGKSDGSNSKAGEKKENDNCSTEFKSEETATKGLDPAKEFHVSSETPKGAEIVIETTETTKEKHNSAVTNKSAGMHRTRLSTGSIFFDSELLKTSPSKFDQSEDRTEKREKRVLEVKKKLSLSPSRKTTSKLPGQKSMRQSFFFTHGYAQCEHCKKIFWKMNRLREHVRKCSRRKGGESTSDSDGSKVNLLHVRKKRPLSLSPGNSEGAKTADHQERGDSEDGSLRKRPCRKQEKPSKDSDTRKDSVAEKTLPIVDQSKPDDFVHPPGTLPKKIIENSKELVKDSSELQEECDKGENNGLVECHNTVSFNKDTPSNIVEDSARTNKDRDMNDFENQKLKPVASASVSYDEPGTSTSYLDESDDDSDFSGFSEVDEDVKEGHLEKDNTANDMDSVVGTEAHNINGENPLSDEPVVNCNDNSRVTRQGEQKSLSLRDKKKSRSTLSRSFVCDSDKRGKMVCQVSKDIDKIIDSINLVCRHCDSKHTSVSNLRQHAIRHLGWKRYKCNLCSFSNYNLSELKLHLSRKHCIKGSEIDVKQYVSDLKTEARNKRVSKRSNTLREHKAKGISTKSSPNVYAKPRPSMSATTTKAGRNIKQESIGATSLLPSKTDDLGQLSSGSALTKARERLSNILKS